MLSNEFYMKDFFSFTHFQAVFSAKSISFYKFREGKENENFFGFASLRMCMSPGWINFLCVLVGGLEG